MLNIFEGFKLDHFHKFLLELAKGLLYCNVLAVNGGGFRTLM